MKYFIIAGEASGDLHASNLMKELKSNDALAEFVFLGGDLMCKHGGRLLVHYRDMAFMGYIAVILNLRKIINNINVAKKGILEFNPDVVILVDYPSFNLQIAKFVKQNTNIPVYYYISPKIWAWKEYRIKTIKKYIDKMFTIFPFETAFYNKHNFEVNYVGNPTVDSIKLRKETKESFVEFCNENNLSNLPVVALLAGSRKQEIVNCLPRMIQAASHIDGFQIVVAGAPGIDIDLYQQFIDNGSIKVVFGKTYQLLSHSKAAIVNSGTATLETALLKTPQVVVYHYPFGRLAIYVRKLILKVKYISLVNLIAEKEVVKELFATQFTVANTEKELRKLLFDKSYIEAMQQEYNSVLLTLGETGAAKKLANEIIDGLV